MVSELEKILSTIDNASPGSVLLFTINQLELTKWFRPRKSLIRSPGRSSDLDVLAPDFLATVLKQQSRCESLS